MRIGLLALVCGGLLLGASPALAAPPNGCVGLYDPGRGAAADVYVSVERADETAVCFLIPRTVLVEKYQSGYSDGMAASIVVLSQDRMLAYLDGRQSITVAAEARPVAAGMRECLARSTFDAISIASGFEYRPTPSQTVSTFAKAVASDLPGYRRLTSDLHDFYWPETEPDLSVPVGCWRSVHPDLCSIRADYDKATIDLQFQKSELATMAPAKALKCVRDFADLFKVTKSIEPQ